MLISGDRLRLEGGCGKCDGEGSDGATEGDKKMGKGKNAFL
jgi:hypothetical protein